MEIGTLILRTTSTMDEYLGVVTKPDFVVDNAHWYLIVEGRGVLVGDRVNGNKSSGKWQVLGSKEFVEWQT